MCMRYYTNSCVRVYDVGVVSEDDPPNDTANQN